MKLAEVLEALKAGKRIRRSCWAGAAGDCFEVSASNGVCVAPADLLADDWEVVDPVRPIPQSDFAGALQAMHSGKSVRRRAWLSGDLRPFKQRQAYLIEDGIAYFHPGPEGLPRLRAIFDSEDVLATDWEILP